MSEQPDETNRTLDAILARRRRKAILQVVGFGAVIAIGGALYWIFGRSEPVEPLPATPMPTAEVAPPASAPVAPETAAPAPPIDPMPDADARPLPPLQESDAFVRGEAARWSSRPEWTTWLATDELIRRGVASVDAIAQGESPAEQAPASMRFKQRFEVVSPSPEASPVASPASFARYDLLTNVLTSLDATALARARRTLGPLLDAAYHDLGHSNRTFDQALRDAIFALLMAPDVVGQPPLEPLTLGYAYVDPDLEELSDAKKQLLRFGPANVARLQQKIREVAVALGIPAEELPRTPRHEVRAVESQAVERPSTDDQAAP